jgi:hypothetical protein
MLAETTVATSKKWRDSLYPNKLSDALRCAKTRVNEETRLTEWIWSKTFPDTEIPIIGM